MTLVIWQDDCKDPLAVLRTHGAEWMIPLMNEGVNGATMRHDAEQTVWILPTVNIMEGRLPGGVELVHMDD